MQLFSSGRVLTGLRGLARHVESDLVTYSSDIEAVMKWFRIPALVLIAVFTRAVRKRNRRRICLPAGVESLRQGATSKTEFTLDHSMLVFAAKIDPADEDLQRVIAGVSGVSVHSYHFPRVLELRPGRARFCERRVPGRRVEATDKPGGKRWWGRRNRYLGSHGE
jgi:hypothetical protein